MGMMQPAAFHWEYTKPTGHLAVGKPVLTDWLYAFSALFTTGQLFRISFVFYTADVNKIYRKLFLSLQPFHHIKSKLPGNC